MQARALRCCAGGAQPTRRRAVPPRPGVTRRRQARRRASADEAGEEVLAATYAHDENGLRSLCRSWCVWKWCWSRSSGRTGCWWSGSWTRGCRCCRYTRTRWRRRATGSGSRAEVRSVRRVRAVRVARTDHHRFRVLEPDSDQTKAIRALTRAREDLVGDADRGANQLRAELERFWPGPLRPVHPSGQPRSRWRSLSATRARPTRAGWAWRACRRFWRASGTRAPAARRCWPSSGARPRSRRRARAGRPPAARARLGRDDQDAERADQGARAPDRAPRSASIPTARSSCRCSKARTA